MAGLGPGGLQIATQEEIRASILSQLKQPPPVGLGIDVDDSPSSNLYFLANVMAYILRLCWEGLLEVWDSLSPDAADGARLDNVCALTGLSRLEATPANGYVTCYGTPGTVIPDWTGVTPGLVRKPSTGDIFRILPEPTGGVWTIAPGGSVEVLVQAALPGALSIASDQITEIVNPVAGWASVNNPVTGTSFSDLGTDDETDAALRERRERSLFITGTCADQAIRAALEAIAEVVSASVTSNRSMIADPVTGQPPKSFWTIIYPDLTADPDAEEVIARTLWERMPAGIQSWGDPGGTTRTGTVIDSHGYSQTVQWQYAVEVPMRVKAVLTVDTNYPADGDARVAAFIAQYIGGLGVGDDVSPAPMLGLIGDVPGVLEIELQQKTVAAGAFGAWPADTSTVAISAAEHATIVPGEITVTS